MEPMPVIYIFSPERNLANGGTEVDLYSQGYVMVRYVQATPGADWEALITPDCPFDLAKAVASHNRGSDPQTMLLAAMETAYS